MQMSHHTDNTYVAVSASTILQSKSMDGSQSHERNSDTGRAYTSK